MKVIKHGRPRNSWSGEYECTGQGSESGGCGALLLVEEDDLFETARFCSDPDFFSTFRCPECGVWTNFPQDDVPQEVWNKCLAMTS